MPQKSPFKPSVAISLLRFTAKFISSILLIRGDNRWGNEFAQSLDMRIKVKNPISPGKRITFKTGHGRLYWRSKYTPNLDSETNEWISTFQKEDIFFDIGSNIGVYALMAAQAKGMKVFSFEMDPLNNSIQHYNIFENKLEGLITHMPMPLSDKNSLRKVYFKSISPGDALHSIDECSSYIADKNKINILTTEIPTFSLDFLIKELWSALS